ncbi:MAG: AsmA-like C-terminal region-containing protein [Bacteroidales bacterium]|nr:AsmA-like C-terminal region-containing protein [Bacteroidales bacterium]
MKKAIKIFLITIAVIILLILLLPVIFKGKVIGYAKQQANDQLNATLTFTGGHLTLLNSFPLLSLKLDSLNITGKDQFIKDTLLQTERLYLSFDLMSLFSDQYEIVRIRMENPSVKLRVDETGEVNWDILKESVPDENERQTVAALEETGHFSLGLQNVDLVNASLIYLDEYTGMLIRADQMQLAFRGDLTEDQTSLEFNAGINELSIDYEGFPVLQEVPAELHSLIHADFIAEKYTFSQSNVRLSEISLVVEGYYAEPEGDVEMDLRIASGKSDFKHFLSVIPAIYTRDYDMVQASGTLSIDGFIRGKYTDETLPSFGFKLGIDGGMFQYPGLPANVSQILLNASLDNPGGVMDQTVISVESLHFVMADNPVDASLTIRQPVSDPAIQATVKGRIDLGSVQKIIPLEPGKDYSGILTADARIKGNVSDFENRLYKNILASGTMDAENIRLTAFGLPHTLSIPTAHLELKPDQIWITELTLNYGANDLQAEGYIGDYIPYLLDGKTIKGEFMTSSRSLDIDSLLASLPATERPEVKTQDTSQAAFTVPANIDFSLQASCDQLRYNGMNISNASGWVTIRNGELKLREWKMNLLGGSVTMDGSYAVQDQNRAGVQVSLKVNGFDVQQSYNTLQMIHSFAPVAQKTRGSFSADFTFKSDLNSQLRPDLASVSGSGHLSSSKVVIEDIQVFNQIADMLRLERLKNATIDALNLSFDILDGKVHVSQLLFKIGPIGALLSGYTSLDQEMSFVLGLDIPRSEFGTHFNDVINDLASKINKTGLEFQAADKIKVDVIIGGTFTRPTVTIGLKEAMKNVVDDLKSRVEDELREKKEEAEAMMKEEAERYLAKVDSVAQKLISDAEKQAAGIKSLARQSAQKIRQEADSAAARLATEGKKKGKLGEMAANAAADQLRKEADGKASLLVSEADQRADAILSEARERAAVMRQEARLKFSTNK